MEEIIIDGVNVAECKNYVHIKEERYQPECNCRLTTVERGYYCDTYATSICKEEDCEYKQLKRLEQENARLEEEIEIRDNLSEKFRKEALSWANIANEYQKDKIKLEQTLQEIKAIAEKEIYMKQNSSMDRIIDLITKAEEE